jgi:hypothetical protein
MYQQLWGYKFEEKLYLGVREQKRLNTTGLVVTVLATVPKVIRFKPRSGQWNINGDKNVQIYTKQEHIKKNRDV